MTAATASLPSIAPSCVTLAVEGWNADDIGESESLRRSLDSLRAQSYPLGECEILVVVDAGSAVSTAVEECLPGARIVPIERFTYYRCKNAAMREAHGDFLLFADSDVRYSPNWMALMLGAFRPGVDVVAGHTRYERGFLARTLDLCDGGMIRARDGFTDGFYAHNLALRRSLFAGLRFREDLGGSGGGGAEILRAALAQRGVRAWFAADALAEHPLTPFVRKRLRVGSYHLHSRRSSRSVRGARLARVPLLGPLLLFGGILAKTWGRVLRRRRELPGGVLAIPVFLATTAVARSVELVAMCFYAWAPALLQRRAGWHRVPERWVPER